MGGLLQRSLDDARRRGAGLRIRLRLTDVPELADFPWEYLYVPETESYLALSDMTPIVRYLELPQSERTLRIAPPLRILAVVANPINRPLPDAETELAQVQNALHDLESRGLVNLETLQPPTLQALQDRLRKQDVHVLHFIGEGSFDATTQQGVLAFLDEEGRGYPIPAEVLGVLLRDHDPLRLVFLNACEGGRSGSRNAFAGVAQALVQQGIPTVVAMQFPINDNAEAILSQEFYKALADGYPVDAAVSQARKAIFVAGNKLEWGTPVLFSRANDNRLFELPQDNMRHVFRNLAIRKRIPSASHFSPLPVSLCLKFHSGITHDRHCSVIAGRPLEQTCCGGID